MVTESGNAVTPRGGPPPSRCAECGILLSDALVLTCGHDLCLACASAALRQTRSHNGRAVRCLLCSSVTELCDQAADALSAANFTSGQMLTTENGNHETQTRHAWPQEPRASQAQRENNSVTAQLFPPDVQEADMRAAKKGQACSAVSMHHGATLPAWGLPAPRPCATTKSAASHMASQRRIHDDGRMVNGSPSNGACGGAFIAGNGEHHSHGRSKGGPFHEESSVPSSPIAMAPGTPKAFARKIELMSHSSNCSEHPDEPATYFCVTCECTCICAECIVHGPHRGHEVMRVGRAFEALRARAGALLDEAQALEDDFAVVTDKLAWRRKDIERAAARGRASVRSAFARVRAQLADRETELLESLDAYEGDSLSRLERGTHDHDIRLSELSRLQESLRSRCRSGDAVDALNTYAAAKASISALREGFNQEEHSVIGSPADFINLAGSAKAEMDLHAEGLASLEEAVASLCERGTEFDIGASTGKTGWSNEQRSDQFGAIDARQRSVQRCAPTGGMPSASREASVQRYRKDNQRVSPSRSRLTGGQAPLVA
eukprot:TRINITY_DN72969_c0_g1_i1.p1 TRINITY_DN72969_c0_g1~~TRINITY_DN72969_c0_g1_i1.p1  ORF type:complete len:549 (+),score=33.07 TRINITY_DN72969_c0_g1_i1:51-1697(+)